jgi:DNA repair protein RadC
MRIKDIPLENRPRERLMKFGPEALSDAEVLAIILKTGTVKENIIDISNRLLSKHGITKLSSLSITELQEIDGIGPAKAMQIAALFEFSKRHRQAKKTNPKIECAKDAYDLLYEKLSDKNQEHFLVLVLNTKNKAVHIEDVSKGTLDASLIHPREVFKPAIQNAGSRIILVHNHPSGDPTPSDADLRITYELAVAAKALRIAFVDHIIIGDAGFWSWKENKSSGKILLTEEQYS